MCSQRKNGKLFICVINFLTLCSQFLNFEQHYLYYSNYFVEVLCKIHTMQGVSRYYYITKHKKINNNNRMWCNIDNRLL